MERFLKFIVLSFFLLAGGVTLFGQKVSLQGCAPEYSGIELTFYRNTDRISNTNSNLVKVQLAADGTFATHFVLDEITQVYVDLGSVKGYFYAEPGKAYHLILPPYRPDLNTKPAYPRSKHWTKHALSYAWSSAQESPFYKGDNC